VGCVGCVGCVCQCTYIDKYMCVMTLDASTHTSMSVMALVITRKVSVSHDTRHVSTHSTKSLCLITLACLHVSHHTRHKSHVSMSLHTTTSPASMTSASTHDRQGQQVHIEPSLAESAPDHQQVRSRESGNNCAFTSRESPSPPFTISSRERWHPRHARLHPHLPLPMRLSDCTQVSGDRCGDVNESCALKLRLL